MRVLWVSEFGDKPGGGSTSENMLLNYMADAGVKFHRWFLENRPEGRAPFEIDVVRRSRALVRQLEGVARKVKFDVVVVQGNQYPWVVDWAKSRDLPVAVFVRDYFYRCPNALHDECGRSCFKCVPFGQKVLYPFVKYNMVRKRRGLVEADMVLTNSNHMARDIWVSLDLAGALPGPNVQVVYPPVPPPVYLEDDGPHDRVVYMGCGYWKGTEMAMRMARWNHDVKFEIAADPAVPLNYNLNRYPNVRYWKWIDRDLAFNMARVILFPATWPEPFGRIPVEAGQRAVPTIASDIGGLPEAVGDGGVLLPPKDDDMWNTWIRTFMDGERAFRHFGMKAEDHACKFTISREGPKFLKHLEGL